MEKKYNHIDPAPYLPITVSWFEHGKKWQSELETETEWMNFVWQWNKDNTPFNVEETA